MYRHKQQQLQERTIAVTSSKPRDKTADQSTNSNSCKRESWQLQAPNREIKEQIKAQTAIVARENHGSYKLQTKRSKRRSKHKQQQLQERTMAVTSSKPRDQRGVCQDDYPFKDYHNEEISLTITWNFPESKFKTG